MQRPCGQRHFMVTRYRGRKVSIQLGKASELFSLCQAPCGWCWQAQRLVYMKALKSCPHELAPRWKWYKWSRSQPSCAGHASIYYREGITSPYICLQWKHNTLGTGTPILLLQAVLPAPCRRGPHKSVLSSECRALHEAKGHGINRVSELKGKAKDTECLFLDSHALCSKGTGFKKSRLVVLLISDNFIVITRF